MTTSLTSPHLLSLVRFGNTSMGDPIMTSVARVRSRASSKTDSIYYEKPIAQFLSKEHTIRDKLEDDRVRITDIFVFKRNIHHFVRDKSVSSASVDMKLWNLSAFFQSQSRPPRRQPDCLSLPSRAPL